MIRSKLVSVILDNEALVLKSIAKFVDASGDFIVLDRLMAGGGFDYEHIIATKGANRDTNMASFALHLRIGYTQEKLNAHAGNTLITIKNGRAASFSGYVDRF